MEPFSLAAEVRWFGKGKRPEPVFNYVLDQGEFSYQESRTDDYLVFPNSTAVGVKLRENLFEIKSLVKQGEVLKLSGGLHAIIEVWEKLSLDQGIDASKINKHNNLLSVQKSRIKCILKKHQASWITVDESQPVNEGCQLEATEVVIEGNVFWTFSMEAFSKSRAPELMLADASDHIEADEKFQELCVEGHFKGQSAESYNSFLNSFKK